MEKRRKSPVGRSKVKKKMTQEQVQLAIIRKKECDAQALKIVERLLEPDVDHVWLMDNLKDINRCHMEDVIEERAIVKLCGYVLCQKPLTVVYNQRYHISLKDKKVYDVTNRKNFCSSSCFGASNYLLEQMLTSPLWLRNNEEIPEFKIFYREKQKSEIPNTITHGKEVSITDVKDFKQQNIIKDTESQETRQSASKAEGEIVGCIENFVLTAVQDFELKGINSEVDKTCLLSDDQTVIGSKSTLKTDDVLTSKKVDKEETGANEKYHLPAKSMSNNSMSVLNDDSNDDLARICDEKIATPENQMKSGANINKIADVVEKILSTSDDDDVIEQCIYFTKNESTCSNIKCSDQLEKNHIESDDVIEQFSYHVQDKSNETSTSHLHPSDVKVSQGIGCEKLDVNCKSKPTKKKTQKSCKKLVGINLAANVEKCFHEWITDQTINYLFGDESIKQEMIKAIEMQENYEVLCKKLDRLQAEEDREDSEVLKTPSLKPAPHFSVLKEEGEKLDIKVRAFYEGKTTFEEPPKSIDDDESSDNLDKFLPLTDIHAPQIVRRKIFLEKLDQILPDLLRTLAGNNAVYARASLNYSSVRCTAVKALLHTFSLSATNIVFKTAEWTLVGLVIIKMLSLSDAYLASLLATEQANMYISMILTAYKLNSDYLNLLTTSFNPNMNPR